MTYYKKYRNHRYYKKSYERTSLFEDFLDMLLDIIIILGGLILKSIFKLSVFLFNRGKKAIGDFKVNKLQPNAIPVSTDNFIAEDHKKTIVSTPILQDSKQTTTKTVFFGKPEDIEDKKYELKKSLLTSAEQNFLEVLKEIVGDKYIIQSQVPLYQIVSAVHDNYTDFNRIKAKTVDFVLYNKDFSPYLVIELDDRSHLRWSRMKRDKFVNDLMESVNLRIIHIRNSYHYDIEYIKSQILYNLLTQVNI